MAEPLPERIHGAGVFAGRAPASVADPLLDRRRADGSGHIRSSRTQTSCRVPGGGRFWVEGGERVVVEATTDERPAPWLHATVGAFVLAQQGRFALHANVVEVEGLVMAVAGPRGAGKSTTSLALLRAGHRLLTDDVATLDPEGDAVVHRPAGRPVHVDPATATRLGVSTAGGVPVAGDPAKLALPNACAAPVGVDAIVVLRAVEHTGARVELQRLSPTLGAGVVHRQAYRRALLDPVWRADLFAWAAAVASRVPVWTLTRPATRWTTTEVCATLESLGWRAIRRGDHRRHVASGTPALGPSPRVRRATWPGR